MTTNVMKLSTKIRIRFPNVLTSQFIPAVCAVSLLIGSQENPKKTKTSRTTSRYSAIATMGKNGLSPELAKLAGSVDITDEPLGDSAPRGMMGEYADGEIYLKAGARDREQTMIHEYGHHIDSLVEKMDDKAAAKLGLDARAMQTMRTKADSEFLKARGLARKDDYSKAVSPYGATTNFEWHAESFRLWNTTAPMGRGKPAGREWLKSVAPSTFKYWDTLCRAGGTK